ncbi:MAG TPA: hypothetical protein ENJ49_00170 [Candidatus Moranbacteria bacterium]|nr:hypothetical protein [Candidatus Moranbacteria bacterium]
MVKHKKETYGYKGWLISDSFIKRVLAITGYYLVGQILKSLVLVGVWMLFLLLSWLLLAY